MKFKFTIWCLMVCVLGCCAQPVSPSAVVIRNVNVVTMKGPSDILYHATVVLNQNRIESVNGTIPEDAAVVDGTGKWLIPGLTDMHVHIPTNLNLTPKLPGQPADIIFNVQDLMTPFVASGVTTILNLNADSGSFYQRGQIENGTVTGPRMLLALLIDGGKGKGIRANTPGEGRQTVRVAKAEGYEFIKLYSGLDEDTYNAIIDEAYKQGLKTVGHIPTVFQSNLQNAFVPHFGLVAHAEEFSKSAVAFTYDEALRFALMAKNNGTWVSPTLTAMDWIADQTMSLERLKASETLQYVHPLLQSKWLTANSYNRNSSEESRAYFRKLREFQPLLVRAFKETGVPILAGTDCGVSGVVAGFSLHDELALLVKAGLTPYEALNSATNLAALWLGISSETGTVEAGKRADLVLLDENPLADIANTRKISGVVVNGVWMNQEKIRSLLAALAEKNAQDKERFDWNKTMKK